MKEIKGAGNCCAAVWMGRGKVQGGSMLESEHRQILNNLNMHTV